MARNFPNIEKSAFRKGEYVGYADGVWLITRTNSSYGNWIARHRDDAKRAPIYGFRLEEISKKLEAASVKKNPKKRISKTRVTKTRAKKNPAPKIETLFYIRGVAKEGKKSMAGLWTGRGTLTTELAESAHYRDEKSAGKTRDELVKRFPWIEWKVHSTDIVYRR